MPPYPTMPSATSGAAQTTGRRPPGRRRGLGPSLARALRPRQPLRPLPLRSRRGGFGRRATQPTGRGLAVGIGRRPYALMPLLSKNKIGGFGSTAIPVTLWRPRRVEGDKIFRPAKPLLLGGGDRRPVLQTPSVSQRRCPRSVSLPSASSVLISCSRYNGTGSIVSCITSMVWCPKGVSSSLSSGPVATRRSDPPRVLGPTKGQYDTGVTWHGHPVKAQNRYPVSL